MSGLIHDPIHNAIYKGLKDDIEFIEKNKRYRATLLLIFSAMDAMAFLSMPGSQSDVKRHDFVCWTAKYIKFPGSRQLLGAELYGARCGLLHTYGTESQMSREGKCRQLMFVDDVKNSAVRDNGNPKFVLVSIAGLKTALFAGIDSFLVDLFASPTQAMIAEKRLPKLLIVLEDVPGTAPQLRPFLEGPP